MVNGVKTLNYKKNWFLLKTKEEEKWDSRGLVGKLEQEEQRSLGFRVRYMERTKNEGKNT